MFKFQKQCSYYYYNIAWIVDGLTPYWFWSLSQKCHHIIMYTFIYRDWKEWYKHLE